MTDITNGQARVSVNLDIANLPPEAPAYIIREAAAYGRIVTARAFADYRRNDLSDLPVYLFQLGFQLIHCPSWPNGGGRLKSVVDSILAQDLRDQAEDDPTIGVFILGSGDRDFMAVVHALRRHGRRVIIAATPDASNRSMVAGADGYIPLPMPDRPDRHDRHDRFDRFERHQPPVYHPTSPAYPPLHQPTPVLSSQTPAISHPPSVAAPHQPPTVVPHPVSQPAVTYPAAQPAPPSLAPIAQTAPPPVQPVSIQTPPAHVPPQGHAHQFHPQPAVSLGNLTDQILALVTNHPLITPRQVLQTLAPRNEPGSARRRQTVGDAIALLVQQGKLIRRPENVRGRVAEVLAFPTDEVGETAAPVSAPAPVYTPSPAPPPVRRPFTPRPVVGAWNTPVTPPATETLRNGNRQQAPVRAESPSLPESEATPAFSEATAALVSEPETPNEAAAPVREAAPYPAPEPSVFAVDEAEDLLPEAPFLAAEEETAVPSVAAVEPTSFGFVADPTKVTELPEISATEELPAAALEASALSDSEAEEAADAQAKSRRRPRRRTRATAATPSGEDAAEEANTAAGVTVGGSTDEAADAPAKPRRRPRRRTRPPGSGNGEGEFSDGPPTGGTPVPLGAGAE